MKGIFVSTGLQLAARGLAALAHCVNGCSLPISGTRSFPVCFHLISYLASEQRGTARRVSSRGSFCNPQAAICNPQAPAASVSPICRLWPLPAPNAPETPAQTRQAPARNRQPKAFRARSGVRAA